MLARRYRDGRLVRQRRLRRATLRNARNLALAQIGSKLLEVRFLLMLDALQDAGWSIAAQEPVQWEGE